LPPLSKRSVRHVALAIAPVASRAVRYAVESDGKPPYSKTALTRRNVHMRRNVSAVRRPHCGTLLAMRSLFVLALLIVSLSSFADDAPLCAPVVRPNQGKWCLKPIVAPDARAGHDSHHMRRVRSRVGMNRHRHPWIAGGITVVLLLSVVPAA